MLQQLYAYPSLLCFNILLQVTRLGSDGDDLCLKHLTFVFKVQKHLTFVLPESHLIVIGPNTNK